MAGLIPLGIHSPAALQYLIREGLLPDDPPSNSYQWQPFPSTASDAEDLLWTKQCVVYSRDGHVQRVFRYHRPEEEVLFTLITTFRRQNKGAGRAVVIFSGAQCHIHFLKGPHFTVGVPFEVEQAFPAAEGLLIQRKIRRKPDTPAHSARQQTNATLLAQPQISPFRKSPLGNLANGLAFSLLDSPSSRRYSIASNVGGRLSEGDEDDLPRLFSLSDPLADFCAVATATVAPLPRHLRNDDNDVLVEYDDLDASEELIYVSRYNEVDEAPDSSSADKTVPLLLMATQNDDLGQITIWQGWYFRPKPLSAAMSVRAGRRQSRAQTPMVRFHDRGRESFAAAVQLPNDKTATKHKRPVSSGLTLNDDEVLMRLRMDPDFEGMHKPAKTGKKSLLSRNELGIAEQARGQGNNNTNARRRGASMRMSQDRRSLGTSIYRKSRGSMAASAFNKSIGPDDDTLMEMGGDSWVKDDLEIEVGRAAQLFTATNDFTCVDPAFIPASEGIRPEFIVRKVHVLNIPTPASTSNRTSRYRRTKVRALLRRSSSAELPSTLSLWVHCNASCTQIDFQISVTPPVASEGATEAARLPVPLYSNSRNHAEVRDIATVRAASSAVVLTLDSKTLNGVLNSGSTWTANVPTNFPMFDAADIRNELYQSNRDVGLKRTILLGDSITNLEEDSTGGRFCLRTSDGVRLVAQMRLMNEDDDSTTDAVQACMEVSRARFEAISKPSRGAEDYQTHSGIRRQPYMQTLDMHSILNQAEKSMPVIRSHEVDRNVIIKRIFSEDRRFVDASRLLNPSILQTAECPPRPEWSDIEHLDQQKRVMQWVMTRTIALSAGDAMVHFESQKPLISEKFHVPGFSMLCQMRPMNNTISADRSGFTEEKFSWAFFHAGASAGLRISSTAAGIDTSWIVFNKPQDLTNRHAGFLLALGLNGHLKAMAKWLAFKYLTPKHTMTSIGLLLGLSASNMGTMDSLITRMLSVHITRMLPAGAAELNVSPLTQTAGLLGIGLLYYNTQHRRMSEMMLSELEYRENEDAGSPPDTLRDESYRLAAGFSIGLMNLGKSSDLRSLHGLHLLDRLLAISVGPRPVELVHVIDKATAASIIAIAFIYMKSNDQSVAQKIDVPDTLAQLDYIRPDALLLRALAKNLIMWDYVSDETGWIQKQLPAYCSFPLSGPGRITELRSKDIPTYNIVTGHAWSLSLRFAGSGSISARDEVLSYLDILWNVSQSSAEFYDAQLARTTVRRCIDVLALSAATIMAGTGDLQTFRHLRRLHGRADDQTTYGSHMATHLAIGALFLGGGTYTFATSNLAIASLVMAFYPLFPSDVLDNAVHLQAFRHLWVIAAQPRAVEEESNTGPETIITKTLTRLNQPPNNPWDWLLKLPAFEDANIDDLTAVLPTGSSQDELRDANNTILDERMTSWRDATRRAIDSDIDTA